MLSELSSKLLLLKWVLLQFSCIWGFLFLRDPDSYSYSLRYFWPFQLWRCGAATLFIEFLVMATISWKVTAVLLVFPKQENDNLYAREFWRRNELVIIDENAEFIWKCEYHTAENLLIAFPCSFWNCFYIPKYITAPA